MSADNFYYVKGESVWMGFQSDYQDALDEAERRWFAKLARQQPAFTATTHEEAIEWAADQYSEYGIRSIDE